MITINKIKFKPRDDCTYKHDYVKISKEIRKRKSKSYQKKAYRKLIKTDLFFIVYFVLGVTIGNHPFVVAACREIEDGPRTNMLYVWARFHFKSTIITMAGTIQYHLNNPDHCTCIFSYKKGAAEKFVKTIKVAYESDFLVGLFPELLYYNPRYEATAWSTQSGIAINRENKSRPQNTVQASGLIEGMLQGEHFERRIYDDIETRDIMNSPEQLTKCFECFEMSKNLGTGMDSDIVIIIGTFFSHQGPIVKIKNLKDFDKKPVYTLSLKPATDNGEEDGKPVFVSQKYLDSLKKDSTFASQQLLNPTAKHAVKLKSALLKVVPATDIPNNLYFFMVIDPAGDKTTNTRGSGKDSWAIHIIGVEPVADNIGASNIYIVDMFISTVGEAEAITLLAKMYFSSGLISQVGYERLGNITPAWLFHFQNILQQRGVLLSKEVGNLVLLKHKNRAKKQRITDALQLPLINGKIHISSGISEIFRIRLSEEMDKHPMWHDDGIDALAYIYDMLDDFGFQYKINRERKKLTMEPRYYGTHGWMGI